MSADHLLLTPQEVYDRYVQASRMGADLHICAPQHSSGVLIVRTRLQRVPDPPGAAASRCGHLEDTGEMDVSPAIREQLTR